MSTEAEIKSRLNHLDDQVAGRLDDRFADGLDDQVTDHLDGQVDREGDRVDKIDRIDRLADALWAVNSGDMAPTEARDLLSEISQVDLSLAEQRLLERGVAPTELQGLCKVHLEVLEPQVQDLKNTAGKSHPLHTLVAEHDLILGFLSDLTDAVDQLATKSGWDDETDDDVKVITLLRTMQSIAYHLVETEKHHQREEEALFPEIEAAGITGPTRIMRLEHDDLRPRKKALKELLGRAEEMDFIDFVAQLKELSDYTAFNLRDHIFKENTILYPAAFDALKDPSTWKRIKDKCDEIGYCCFTPDT